MIYPQLIDLFYPEDNALRRLLLLHSGQVRDKALDIVDRHPELGANRQLVEEGAMLHDLGIFKTHAPGIYCTGSAPYILHGRLGAELLLEQGYPTLARFCERHTGTGITRAAIEARQLPLPLEDFVPETIEEQIVCYADKFFSKSHPERVRTVEQAAESLSKYGQEGVDKFRSWAQRFE